MRFKIDWASLIVGMKFTVFSLFCFVFEGNFQVQAPGGAYIRRGDLMEGFLRYEFGGLIFRGAYFRNFTVYFLHAIFKLTYIEQHCTYSKYRDRSDYTLRSPFQEFKNNKNGYPLKVVAVTGGGELQEVTTVSLQLGKVYGVLEKWSLMGGGRLWEGRHTWRFNNKGKKVVKA